MQLNKYRRKHGRITLQLWYSVSILRFFLLFTFNISVICFGGSSCMQYMFGLSFCDLIYKTLKD